MARFEDKRIQFLKLDGTDLYTEGDIAGATGLYVTAMQLETDRELRALSSADNTEDTAELDHDPHNNNTINGNSLYSERSDHRGMKKVLETVLEQAEEAMKVNPTLPKPYLSKATVLILQNKWDEARDVYSRGIDSCENCADLRQAMQKLHKTQSLLKSIPNVIQRTSSVSSDTSECNIVSDGKSTLKSKRFRMQHRKKLSRPKSDFVTSPTNDVFTSKYEEKSNETEDNTQENLPNNICT